MENGKTSVYKKQRAGPVDMRLHAKMLLLHRYYGDLSTANLPWSASRVGIKNNRISILTEEKKSALALMISHTLCKHAHTYTLENGKEKILSARERLTLGSSLSPSPSVRVWACWVTRGWNLSFRFQPLLSPKAVLFNYLYSLRQPLALSAQYAGRVYQLMAVSWNTGCWINGGD